MRKRRPIGEAKTTCSKCQQPKEVGREKQRYCNSCHAAYMREHRPVYSELSEEAKQKSNARSYANMYLRRGKIIKQPCIVCGSPARMYHKDYSKPLEITWLCAEHGKGFSRYSQRSLPLVAMYETPQSNTSTA